MSKNVKIRLWIFGVGVALLAGWMFMAARDIQSLTPPSDATTLAVFAKKMPSPQRVAQVNDGGATKIVWIGRTAFRAIPSGPSCYVFDSSGQLIDWSSSTGDGESTTRYSERAWDSDALTVDQAAALVPHTPAVGPSK